MQIQNKYTYYGDLFVDSVYKGLHGSYFIHMQALQNVSYTIFR